MSCVAYVKIKCYRIFHNVKKQTKFVGILTKFESKKKYSKKNYKDRNNFRIFICIS